MNQILKDRRKEARNIDLIELIISRYCKYQTAKYMFEISVNKYQKCELREKKAYLLKRFHKYNNVLKRRTGIEFSLNLLHRYEHLQSASYKRLAMIKRHACVCGSVSYEWLELPLVNSKGTSGSFIATELQYQGIHREY